MEAPAYLHLYGDRQWLLHQNNNIPDKVLGNLQGLAFQVGIDCNLFPCTVYDRQTCHLFGGGMQGIEITLQRDFQVSLHHPGFMQTRTLVSTGKLTVDFVHSQTGQTFSDGPLVARMNVFYILHQIGNIDHGSILYLPQHEFLLFTQ